MEGPPFSLECKRAIETAHLSVNLTRLKGHSEHSTLRVETDRFLHDRAVLFPSCMNIVPSSCRGLEVENGAVLTMRFRVAKCNDKLMSDSMSKDENKMQQFAGKPCCVTVCRSKVDVVRYVIFDRILPLPSDDWEDIAATAWFCRCRHHHASDANDHQSHSIEHRKIFPLPTDCFYNNVELVVHHSVLCKDVIGVRETRKCANNELLVYCKPCRTVIGLARRAEYNQKDVWHVNVGCQLVAVSHVSLWRHQINVHSESQELSFQDISVHDRSLEKFVAMKLIVESKQQMHRFILQALPPVSTVYACLWLMNVDVKLFTNCLNPVCHLVEQRETNRGHIGDPECFNVLKLLYKLTCVDDAAVSLGIHWQRDASVQNIVLPVDWCLRIVVVLSSNSMTLPPSQRIANDFKVAYLRR